MSELSQQEPSAATAASEVSLAACVRQPSGVYEAHTVVSNRQVNAADAAAASSAATTPFTGVKTRQRRIGISMAPELPLVVDQPSRPTPIIEPPAPPAPIAVVPLSIKQSSLRVGDEVACHRCSKCNAPFEEFSEEELGLCIVIISTFVHREPALAATMLPEILRCNSKCVSIFTYFGIFCNSSFESTDGQGAQLTPGKWVAICTYPVKLVLLRVSFSGAFCTS